MSAAAAWFVPAEGRTRGKRGVEEASSGTCSAPPVHMPTELISPASNFRHRAAAPARQRLAIFFEKHLRANNGSTTMGIAGLGKNMSSDIELGCYGPAAHVATHEQRLASSWLVVRCVIHAPAEPTSFRNKTEYVRIVFQRVTLAMPVACSTLMSHSSFTMELIHMFGLQFSSIYRNYNFF